MLQVKLVKKEQTTLYGVWSKTNDRTIAKDIPSLSEKYHKTSATQAGKVFPFYVLSRNYDEKSGNSELFVAGLVKNGDLESLTLPARDYAVITVKPKFGFLWGLAVGEAKRYFYTKWLPQSDYIAENLEYEYHTEKSAGKNPSVDIIFAIRAKNK